MERSIAKSRTTSFLPPTRARSTSRRLWIALVSLTLVVPSLLSCRKPAVVELGTPFTLHVGQAARFSKSDLEIYFRRVASDSRCPRGVQCIQAGDATVTLEGRILKGAPESFDVPIQEGMPPDQRGRAYDGYKIWLLSLEPYPVSSGTADTTAYVASFRVEKR